MSAVKKILLTTGACILLGIGLFTLSNNNNKADSNEKNDYSEIYKNIETETTIKKVQFDTFEEMAAYSENINNIQSLEEAKSFIADFYNSCKDNNIEIILTYYNSEIWDNILNNKAYPFYDESNTLVFSVENLEVNESNKENSYIVKYDLIAKDSVSNETIAKLKRKDTLKLSKLFEKITIEDYKRETIEEKYY